VGHSFSDVALFDEIFFEPVNLLVCQKLAAIAVRQNETIFGYAGYLIFRSVP